MGDGPDGQGNGADTEPCATCGTTVDVGEWHPLDASIDASGFTTLYVFCSTRCRREWRAEGPMP